jgi:hypothetical protein
MSDVPLLKKRIYIKSVDSNKNTITWKVNPTGVFSKDIGDLFYETDVRDALRKFQDLIKSRAKYHLNNIETKRQCFLEDEKILYLFKEIFGVLDSQNDKESDSP